MMTPSFPFFRPPMYYNSYYNHTSSNNLSHSTPYTYNNHSSNNKTEKPHDLPQHEKKPTRDSDDQYFEIFGIRLYFDDILILCLLFFLYKEEVHDQLLFIALLLLLLS